MYFKISLKMIKYILEKMIIMENIDKYINQDINDPIYLFHGSPKRLSELVPQSATDSLGNKNNIATAVFLFPSFLKATPYAFKDTIKDMSENLDWSFSIPNNDELPIMKMENVNIDENIIGYIYVFKKDDKMIKDEKTYQYKCYEKLIPIDIVEIKYKDYSHLYEVGRLIKK